MSRHRPRAHVTRTCSCSCRDEPPAAAAAAASKQAPPYSTHTPTHTYTRTNLPHLGVLVDEDKRVRHVPVPQVHHAQADPRAALGLDYSQDSPHFLAHRGALLDPDLTPPPHVMTSRRERDRHGSPTTGFLVWWFHACTYVTYFMYLHVVHPSIY